MTETHVYGTDQAEVSVWDTTGTRVWGPSPAPVDPDPGPYPATTDPMIQRLRPPVDALTNVYLVDPSTPDAYQTINAAFSAVGQGRDAQGIRGSGPQDFALILVAPGDYEERIRPADWTALVSTTGDPADVRVWWDFEVGAQHRPVLNPTGPCYIEGIHVDGIGHYEGDPGAGNAPGTLWLVNGATGSTVTLVNVRSTSNNKWLNSGAFQCGDLSTVMAYQTEFIMTEGSQPMNVQTSQAWRSMKPAHRSEYTFIDCEATGAEGLVTGIADLGHGAHDRLTWTGGTIHTTPLTTAQFFHSSYMQARNPDNPYNCVSYCTPQVTYAGEGEHYWTEPTDLEDSLPIGGIARTSQAYYFPQALDKIGTLATATPDTDMVMQAGRWYFIPVEVSEGRTLAGFSLDVVAGAGGTLRAALWEGQIKGSEFYLEAEVLRPRKWLSLGASAPIAPGTVNIARGTYKRVRIYPGPQVWVGVMADTECTVRASSTLASGGLVMYQDSPSVPTSPAPTPMPTGLTPAPVVKTGIV